MARVLGAEVALRPVIGTLGGPGRGAVAGIRGAVAGIREAGAGSRRG